MELLNTNETKKIASVSTVFSGLLSSLLSFSEVFLGRALVDFGPILSLIIAAVWAVSFYCVFFGVGIASTMNSLEEELKNTGDYVEKQDLQKEIKKLRPRYISYFVGLPWILTFILWTVGVILHMNTPRVIDIQGIVQYSHTENTYIKGMPVSEAEVLVQYGKTKRPLITDEFGTFETLVDFEEGVYVVVITCSKKNHRTESISKDINDSSRIRETIYLRTYYKEAETSLDFDLK